MNNSDETAVEQAGSRTPHVLRGIGGSPGVAVAPAVVIRSRVIDVPEQKLAPEAVDAEWQRFEAAREQTREQLKRLRAELDAQTKNGEAGILDAHLMVLDDDILVRNVRQEIVEDRRNAEWAVKIVANTFIKRFLQIDDPYLQERAEDISDVARRFIRNLLGISEELPERWSGPCIVVAENLAPSETIALPRDCVKGIALDRGSMTSHAALIARALEIPAVFGLGNLATVARRGEIIGLDGSRGVVIVNPSPEDLNRLDGMAAERADMRRKLADLRNLPAVTGDGKRITLLANIENVDEMAAVDSNGAEGVGLFRTEYLWMASGRPVDEAQQTAAYAVAVRALRGRPLIVRAFDLGGDKFVGNVAPELRETNPFLGLRSIRYLLRHPNIFQAQLRAILRARADGDVRLMFPMISDVSELLRSREIVNACMLDVTAEGVECPPIQIGVMIEVPSAALTADLLAEHADFFSIGTNDLTQYTLAADRINEHVVELYQPLHPSVLRLIELTVAAGRRKGIPVSVCGEMASDPMTALLLIGMGIESLSMAPAAIPGVKDAIRKTTLTQARELAERVLASTSAADSLQHCRQLLGQVAPELLRLG